MKKIVMSIAVLALLVACSNKKEEVSIHTRIEMYEDSVVQWGGGQGDAAGRNAFADRYIDLLKTAAEQEPDNELTPTYLDRVHMWYLVKHDAVNAVKWAEMVVEKYPKYVNRQMLLESLATIYDSDITPRDSAKVRKYYMQLLNEYPNIDASVKEDVLGRLKYNNLTFEEYIMKQIKEAEENVPLD
jgi:outer membrane protein assembly factor BamD (BamD/ComL family)